MEASNFSNGNFQFQQILLDASNAHHCQRESKAIDCPWRVNITWPETALKIKPVSFIIMNLPLIQLTAHLIKTKSNV